MILAVRYGYAPGFDLKSYCARTIFVIVFGWDLLLLPGWLFWFDLIAFLRVLFHLSVDSVLLVCFQSLNEYSHCSIVNPCPLLLPP